MLIQRTKQALRQAFDYVSAIEWRAPRVVYTDLVPANHLDFDFSQPPKQNYHPNAVLSRAIPRHSWIGKMPDDALRYCGIHKHDLIIFANRLPHGLPLKAGDIVLVPPVNRIDINTGWGQLVQIADIGERTVTVACSSKNSDDIDLHEIPKSKIIELPVCHATFNIYRRNRTTSPIPMIQ